MSLTQNDNNANVDANEVQKFSDLASRWWNPDGAFSTLHKINPLRADYINLNTPVKGLRILDIGCGGGILSEALNAMGAQVTAIDMSEASLSVAKLHLLESKREIDYIHTTAEQLAQERPQHYDIITCLEMLEHVPQPESIVQACHTLLKPSGYAYFSTINRNPKSWLFAIVGAEYVLNLLPKGTHEYQYFIKPSELDAMAHSAKLSTKKMMGLHYNPITKHYKLAKGVDVNYIMLCQKEADNAI